MKLSTIKPLLFVASLLSSCKTNNGSTYLSSIRSICFCGDSYTAGLFYTEDNSPLGEIPSKGYAKKIADKYNLCLSNHSISNATTGEFVRLEGGLSDTIAGKASDLYVVALGINDYWKSTNLGTLDDIRNGLDTDCFYVNMFKIIDSIKQKSASAEIIIMKCLRSFDTPMYDFYSPAVEEIASYAGVYFGETKDDPFLKSNSFRDGMHKDHPSIEEQEKLSESIENIINNTVKIKEN